MSEQPCARAINTHEMTAFLLDLGDEALALIKNLKTG
jgi:hypothetical protein